MRASRGLLLLLGTCAALTRREAKNKIISILTRLNGDEHGVWWLFEASSGKWFFNTDDGKHGSEVCE